MSLYGSNLSNGRSPCTLRAPATNFGASNMSPNRIVAAYTGSAQSNLILRGDENNIGVVVPSVTNNRLLGVLCGNGDGTTVLEPNQHALVCRGGRAQLWVRVPANVNLAAGTGLILATVWDSTNNTIVVGTSTAGANAGCAEPVVKGALVLEPANPIARLLSPLTATGSDTIQLAEVDVDYNHKPLVFERTIALPGIPALAARGLMMAPRGPGICDLFGAQLTTGGSGGGPMTFQFHNSPTGATADTDANMLSTAITIAQDGNDGAIAIAGVGGTASNGFCGADGDTDTNFGLGGAGLQGVLASAALRTFTDKSILTVTVGGTLNTSSNGLFATLGGVMF